MLRGEFHRADGLIVPNNIMTYGAERILGAAFANIGLYFWVGLVEATPVPDLRIEDVVEPTIGVNGYNRLQIERSAVGWPTQDTLNGEPYIESLWLEWGATDGPFDQSVRRLMLVAAQGLLIGDVMALSAPLAADEFTITPDTIQAERTFKYRIYMR